MRLGRGDGTSWEGARERKEEEKICGSEEKVEGRKENKGRGCVEGTRLV